MTNQITETENDKKLYRKAQLRVSFKIHLTIYLLVCAIFWLLWFFIFKDGSNEAESSIFFKLTLGITLFWLVFIVAHYLIAFKWNKNYIEKELNALRKREEKQLKELNELKEKEESTE